MEKPNSGLMKLTGEVVDILPETQFKVKIDGQEHEVIAYLSGKMRMYYIKLRKGDKVDLEVSPHDLTRGRITYRR